MGLWPYLLLFAFAHAFFQPTGPGTGWRYDLRHCANPLWAMAPQPQTEAHAYNERLVNITRKATLLGSILGASALTKPAPADAKVRGYEAAVSAFAPGTPLYAKPLLPQSALLNSLPLNSELIAELQALLESFVQLINPSEKQESQIGKNESVLWTNLRINAQRAAGMFLYNKEDLLPPIPQGPLQQDEEKRTYAEAYLGNLRYNVLKLVNSSRASSVSGSLKQMRYCLNDLVTVAYLLTNGTRYSSLESNAVSRDSTLVPAFEREIDYDRYYRLRGLASVTLTFERPGKERILNKPKVSTYGNPSQGGNGGVGAGTGSGPSTPLPSLLDNPVDANKVISALLADRQAEDSSSNSNSDTDTPDRAKVRLVVDGMHYPLAAGSFVDLCQKGYYDMTVVGKDYFEYGRVLNPDRKNRRTMSSLGPTALSNSDSDSNSDSGAVENSNRNNATVSIPSRVTRKIFGVPKRVRRGSSGWEYVDPLTNTARRVPLEVRLCGQRPVPMTAIDPTWARVLYPSVHSCIHTFIHVYMLTYVHALNCYHMHPVQIFREELMTAGSGSASGGGGRPRSRRFTATGLARNSAVYTKALPVHSFATVRETARV
jgi:hypothetical protein